MLSAESTEILLNYPGLVFVETMDDVILKGVVKNKNKWYNIHLSCPHFPTLKHMLLKVQQKEHWKSFNENEPMVTNQQWTVMELLQNFPQLLKETSSDNNWDDNTHNSNESLHKEIIELHNPHEYEMHLNEAFTKLRFCKFHHYPQHYLEVGLPSLQIISHSLPENIIKILEQQKFASLTELLHEFQEYLDRLSEFYECFMEIDDLCYVLQPVKPTTKHNYRLFLLKDNVFLKLQIHNPFDPIGSKSVQIYGRTNEVEELRKTYIDGLSKWDAELNVHKNLLRIFDLFYFPITPANELQISHDEKGNQEDGKHQHKICNICFAYEYEPDDVENGDIEVPFISCNNNNCNVIFHAACLKQWFSTLAEDKTYLEVSFGTCPFCKTKLSASFVELLQS